MPRNNVSKGVKEAMKSPLELMREQMDEMMGKARDIPLEERANGGQITFDDPNIDRYFLCGCSPYELLKGTKSAPKSPSGADVVDVQDTYLTISPDQPRAVSSVEVRVLSFENTVRVRVVGVLSVVRVCVCVCVCSAWDGCCVARTRRVHERAARAQPTRARAFTTSTTRRHAAHATRRTRTISISSQVKLACKLEAESAVRLTETYDYSESEYMSLKCARRSLLISAPPTTAAMTAGRPSLVGCHTTPLHIPLP